MYLLSKCFSLTISDGVKKKISYLDFKKFQMSSYLALNI